MTDRLNFCFLKLLFFAAGIFLSLGTVADEGRQVRFVRYHNHKAGISEQRTAESSELSVAIACTGTGVFQAGYLPGNSTFSNDEPKEKVIFDTDMGSDCDDVGALALLHVLAAKGKADILGCIYSSGKVPYGAGIVEAINVWYKRPEIPVGASHSNKVGDPADKMQAEKLAKDTAAFNNKIIHNEDAEEQTRLNRRLLAAQEDNSVTYVTVGHTHGLYELLVSEPDDVSPLVGAELVKKKIKRWVALGALSAMNENRHLVKDWNFFFNETAPYTKYLVENFPKPAYFVDGGATVLTGQSLMNTPPGNIVRTAYRDWLWNVEQKILAAQRPSWDLVTVYFAVAGTGGFFDLYENGHLEFDEEKGCRWNLHTNNPLHYFVKQKKGTDEQFAEYLNHLIGLSPESVNGN